MTGEAPGSIRLDKWLWFARLCKSRSLAQRLCAAGAVAIGGGPALRASRPVRVGDLVAVPRGRLLHIVRVRALGIRRGPPAEARGLYEEAAPPRPLAAEARWVPLLIEAGEE